MIINNTKKGFTLIELLVVIAIIALLSTVVLASVGDAREKAAWRAFDSEILQIQKAVQLYIENHNGDWPPSFVDKSNLRTLVGELNSDGSYVGDTPIAPNNETLYLYTGGLSELGNGMSCGGSSWKQNVYYTIYISSDLSLLSNIFGGIYYEGDYYGPDYFCFEFR